MARAKAAGEAPRRAHEDARRTAIPPTTYRTAPTPGGHTDEELRRIEEELDAELSGELVKKSDAGVMKGLR